MQASRQAVITGIGIVSPLGIGREPFWQALRSGVSGIRHLTSLHDQGSLPIGIGGEVLDFDPKNYIRQRKSIKLMCREVAMGVAAAELAVTDSGLSAADICGERFGVIYGSEMLYGPMEELKDVFGASIADGTFQIHRFGNAITSQLFPLWMLQYLPNMAACHVGIAHQAQGPNNTIVQGEASSLLALIEAVTAIERGWADIMIAGGCGCRLNAALNVYLDHRRSVGFHDQPADACRPFDAHRMGQVLSEGAGALVIESREHAERRGAVSLGTVTGFGRSFEPRDSEGKYTGRAIRRVLQQTIARAECSPDSLDHINADGCGTKLDDAIEAQALHDVVPKTPVVAFKSYFGNLGAGVGMVELAASLLAMQDGAVPPSRNFSVADKECPISVIHGDPKPVSGPNFVSLNQSTTGQVAAVSIKCHD